MHTSPSNLNTSFGMSPYTNVFNNTSTSQISQNPHPSITNNQPELRKIFCAYHTTQFLTNFCIQKQCLMPLCPSCVVQHTEQHYQCNQKPTYVNLQESLHEIRQRCYANILKLQDYQKKNIELSSYIIGLPQYLHQQLYTCKEKCIEHINNIFQVYQEKLLEEIRNKYLEEQVYNRKQCQEISQYINVQIENLYQKITELKGQHCLSALIKFYQNDSNKYLEQIGEVQEYMVKNKNAGGLYIGLKQTQYLQIVEDLCDKVIQLQYVKEEELEKNGLKVSKNAQYQYIYEIFRNNPNKNSSNVQLSNGQLSNSKNKNMNNSSSTLIRNNSIKDSQVQKGSGKIFNNVSKVSNGQKYNQRDKEQEKIYYQLPF